MALQFFRRHRKWFMVLMFAAVISMVFWLAWRSMAEKLATWFADTGADTVIGRIAGREVTAGRLGRFVFDVRLAGQAAEWWYQMLARKSSSRDQAEAAYLATLDQSAWPVLARSLEDPEQVDRRTGLVWLALYEEASRYGFRTPEAAVEARLERLRSLGLTRGAFERTVSELARGREDMLRQALARDMTLSTYIRYLYETFSVPVEPEVRREFARQDARIKVRLALLRAAEALDAVEEPSEEVLQKHFNAYKQYLPGEGPDGFGYRIPAKVAIEYLVAEPSAFLDEAAEAVTAGDVKAYYEENKDPEFLVEEPEKEADSEGGSDAPDDDATKTGADDADGDTEPEKTFRPLEEVRDEIRQRLVRRKAEDLAHDHLSACVGDITSKRKGIDLRIWADGKRVRFVQVPGRHTADELAEVEGIGQAARGRRAVPDDALRVVKLVGPEKARLAVGEISEVYTGPEGKAYAFRVTDAAPSREPENLDEVRDAVARDVRRARAFQVARRRAKALLEAAAEDGLQAAAEEAGVETAVSDFFPRKRYVPYGGRWLDFPPALPEVGSSPVLVSECFEMVEEGRVRTLVTLAEKEAVVVAELVDQKAPRQAAYDRFRPMVAQRLMSRLAGQTLSEVLEPGAVERRMTVVAEMVEPETPAAKPEGQDAPPAEADDGDGTGAGGAGE